MVNDVLKIQAMKTAMKNPKLQRLMLDAARAPLGSTRREQARNVLKSLFTAQTNRFQGAYPVLPMQSGQVPMMGQGGPAVPTVNMQNAKRVFLRPVSRPYRFDMPQPRFDLDLTPPGEQSEGQGGPVGIWDKITSLFRKNDGQGAGLNNNTTYGPISVVSSPGPLPSISVTNKPISGATGTYNPQSGGSYNPQLVGGQNLQNTGSIPIQNTSPQVVGNFSNLYNVGQNLSVAPSLPAPAPIAPTTDYYSPDYSLSGNQTYYGGTYGPSFMGPVPGSVSGYQPTGNSLTDYLMQSYGEGIGANAFALGVMADANKLKELFPNVPVDKLPVGASLTGQLMELEDQLRKENNLDLLQQRLNQAVTQGVTLQDDLTAYIRGKDEYLNGIQKMLDKANDTYLASSMRSDPFYSKSMQNYTNYLTILKGRTTQRYVDYLNSSINYHNGQITNLQNAYNSAAQRVNDQFKWQSAMTTEQYQNIKDTLVQMYNNVAQRAGLLDMSSKDSIDLLKSQAGLAQTILENAAKITDPAARQAYLNAYKGLPGMEGIDAAAVTPKGETGTLSATELELVKSRVQSSDSLNDALNDSVLKYNNIPANIIAQMYAQTKAGQYGEQLGKDFSQYWTLYNNAKGESDQLGGLIGEVQQGGGDSSALESLKESYDLAFDKGFSGALDSYVSARLDKFRNVLADMAGYGGSFDDWISGKGWFRLSREGNFDPSKADSIDRSLADAMWAVAKSNSPDALKKMSASQIATLIYNQQQ